MAKNKKKLYHLVYLAALFLALTGAWAGIQQLPNNAIHPGIFGNVNNDRRSLDDFQEDAVLLREDVEVIVYHKDRGCLLDIEHLPAGFGSFYLSGATEEDILSLLNEDWELTVFDPGQLVLEYTRELCPHCQELYYIGLFGEKIAIFSGIPPTGALVEITNYEFKEIYREDLERGIPFSTEEEKKSILESYTT